MKELKIKKGTIKLIGLIILSIFLLLILFWLGYSFFSMKSDKPLFTVLIDLSKEDIAENVVYDRKDIGNKYVEYYFPILPLEISQDSSGYSIVAVDKEFKNNFEDIEEAKFEFKLEKDKGEFDFTGLGWNEPLEVVLKYRVDYDFKYFFEYSSCTLKRIYANIMGQNNHYSKGFCFIERDYIEWRVDRISEEVKE